MSPSPSFKADAPGVVGGHVAYGCTIRTTAEVLLLLLPEWSLSRELDPATGLAELVIRPEQS
jgi:predicted DNA-binding protein with PD1-like motif